MRRLACAALAALMALPGASFGADMGVPLHGPAVVQDTVCVTPRFLGQIQERFNWVQAFTWKTDVRLQSISEVRQIEYKPQSEINYVEKVYCRGRAHLTNGEVQELAFIVSDDQGFVGIRDGVNFCVAGYDWFHLHEPSCRVLNPY